MKTRYWSLFVLLLIQVFISCNKESYELEQGPKEKSLEANTEIADLMLRVSMNDGSNDNILDMANCFNIQLPINVEANGQEMTIESEADFNRIEDIFDAFTSDEDILNITFPITIIKNDFSELQITDNNELSNLASECNGENIEDDDIECIDFKYPISASTFDINTELTNRISIANDKQLFELINSLNVSLVINMEFPIFVRLFNGNELEINDLISLEDIITEAKDDCDEEDDFDYNDEEDEEDEDEINLTESQFTELLTVCNWSAEEVTLDGENETSSYSTYSFSFNMDGTILAENTDTTVTGTWSITSQSNDNLSLLVLNMDSPLTGLNIQWTLVEVNDEDDGTRIEIESGSNELKLKKECD